MLVPLNRSLVPEQPLQPPNSRCSVENGATSDIRDSPGATTSGFADASYQVGPRELNGVTRSEFRIPLLLELAAPAVMAEGALPGEVRPA
jgi:hypothetical protein